MPPVRLGTGCAEMEVPVMALKEMGIDFVHVFSSESCELARKTIQANFEPVKMFGDIRERDNDEVPEQIDVYITGFPCQPFSPLGNAQGFDDKKNGGVFTNSGNFSTEKLPKRS